MKTILNPRVSLAIFLALAPIAATAQTTFFSDNFSNGSTIDSTTPVKPTTNSTSYETIASQAWNPLSSVTNNDLRFGIGNAGGGNITEIQALFATNAVALTLPGDYIQLTVVYTNFAGLYSGAATAVSFGLYNSGQVLPLAGGLGGTNGVVEGDGVTTASGGAQNWVGYMEQVATSSNPNYRLFTRPSQSTVTLNNNQDLTSNGSSTKSFTGATTLNTSTAYVLPSTNQVYTDVFTIKLNGVNSVAITNQLYTNSAVATGTPATTLGGIATNANFLTGGFDALAVGFYKKTDNALSNVMDIASITVSGSVTVISGPPTITAQPVAATVATNGSCAFSVSAVGINVAYQWQRNGTNLLNQGNISGANSSLLAISPAGSNDVLSSANGYSVIVSGAGGYSTNSVTNSLALVAATNLTWTDVNANNTWDLNTTANWQDTNSNPQVFNYGDPVTFDNTGGGGTVNLSGSYLSAASVIVNKTSAGRPYTFGGTGSFAGPGQLIYKGSSQLTINNANTYSGGTIISNASAYLYLENYGGLGTGPVYLLGGGTTPAGLDISLAGSASTGIIGDIIVSNDFTIQYDALGSFAAVFLGNLTGTSGATLTLLENSGNALSGTNNRVRIYGTGATNNANINLNDADTVFAPYNPSGVQVYNGVISGAGTVEEKGYAIFNAANTYTGGNPGGTYLAAGNTGLGVNSDGSPGSVTDGPVGTGALLLWVDSTSTSPANSAGIYASGGARTLGNAIEYPSTTNNLTLIIGGTNALTFTGPITLNGNDAFYTNPVPANMVFYTNRTFQVTNTGLTTFSGVISDFTNGVTAGMGLNETGSGVLALSSGVTETYTGPTTVSAGTLQVNATLDPASAVTVSSNATLSGTGNINGTVTVNPHGTLAPGAASIGSLNINNNLTNAGNISVRVNRSGFVSDKAVVSGVLTNSGTGTVTVTNLGSTLQVGDTFFLFNKALSNGAALTVIGGNAAWNNNLAVNGSIIVASPPDVGVQLTGLSSVALGVNITNTITVTNIGPGTANGMIVTDSLPANATFVSSAGGGTTNANAGQVVWSGFALAANTATNFTLSLKPAGGGYVTNIASVVSSAADPSLANNTATNITLVTTVIIPTVSAHISSFTMVGTNVVINGTNGVNGGIYYLLGATNVATPFSQWTAVSTNIVSTNGNGGAFTFTGTNVVGPGAGQLFYILSNTNN